MKALAQAVIAISLRHPDEARARPETYVKEHSTEIFDEKIDGDLYAACILLDRQVQDYLDGTLIEPDHQRNIRYYVDMCAVSIELGIKKPHAGNLIQNVQNLLTVNPDTLKDACNAVLDIYQKKGATDQIAKSKELTEAVQAYIDGIC